MCRTRGWTDARKIIVVRVRGKSTPSAQRALITWIRHKYGYFYSIENFHRYDNTRHRRRSLWSSSVSCHVMFDSGRLDSTALPSLSPWFSFRNKTSKKESDPVVYRWCSDCAAMSQTAPLPRSYPLLTYSKRILFFGGPKHLPDKCSKADFTK